MKFVAAIVVGAVCLSACSSESGGPTAPTSRIPNVAGSYAGTLTIAYPERGQSVTCPGTTTVTQSGDSVNVAPIVLNGACSGLSIPFGAQTIDSTGNIVGSTTTSFTDPSCGTYNAIGTGGFFGREMRLSAIYTSRTCYNMNITMALTR